MWSCQSKQSGDLETSCWPFENHDQQILGTDASELQDALENGCQMVKLPLKQCINQRCHLPMKNVVIRRLKPAKALIGI